MTVECVRDECSDGPFKSEHGMKIHHKHTHGESLVLEEQVCPNCEETFEAYPSQNRRFCKRECKDMWQEEGLMGENNPFYGKEHSDEFIEFMEKRMDGENHPMYGWDGHWNGVTGKDHPSWEGGGNVPITGRGWTEAREKALERDNYQCVECGISDEKCREMYPSDRGLHVHHIISRKFVYHHPFMTLEDDANYVENLESLCPKCHNNKEAN